MRIVNHEIKWYNSTMWQRVKQIIGKVKKKFYKIEILLQQILLKSTQQTMWESKTHKDKSNNNDIEKIRKTSNQNQRSKSTRASLKHTKINNKSKPKSLIWHQKLPAVLMPLKRQQNYKRRKDSETEFNIYISVKVIERKSSGLKQYCRLTEDRLPTVRIVNHEIKWYDSTK